MCMQCAGIMGWTDCVCVFAEKKDQPVTVTTKQANETAKLKQLQLVKTAFGVIFTGQGLANDRFLHRDY